MGSFLDTIRVPRITRNDLMKEKTTQVDHSK